MADMAKIHAIIHAASAASGGVGAGLSPIPGSDWIPLSGIQIAMITAIALAHGHSVSKATATSLLGTFTASMVGRVVSQVLIGWIPGVGQGVNAATAVALTEAVGWAAHAYFKDLPPAHK